MTWVTVEDVVDLLEQIGLDLTSWEGDGTFPKIETIIEQCQARLESECMRKFDLQEKNETFNGPGGPCIVLSEYPVTQVTSVSVSGASIPISSTALDADRGILYLTSDRFEPGIQNVSITYEHGYAIVPPELREALLKLAAREVITRSPSEPEKRGLKSIRILNFSESYTSGLFANQLKEWNGFISDIIKRYKKVVIR